MSAPVVTPHSNKAVVDSANNDAPDVSGVLRNIAIAHESGNFGRAEQGVRQGEALAPGAPYWPYFRGLVAFKLGLRDAGLAFCADARDACSPK
ncbi:MAG: hypothetical protein JKY20_05065, partial [Alphaproteobacteria bacterium]|nr:hypothetical protein [Alphaproteobacteria bacterium]